jgi:hypothetical protein
VKPTRRTFLSTTGAAGLAASLFPLCSQAADRAGGGRLPEAEARQAKLKGILRQPVLKKGLFTSPVILQSVELLRRENSYVCRVRSTDGAEGVSVAHSGMDRLYPIFLRNLQPFFLGKDARDLDLILETVYIYGFNFRYHGISLGLPLATIEFAILDLLGRMAGRSLGQLIGDIHHPELAVYVATEWRERPLEETFDRIKQAVAEYDAKALKIKVGYLMFMTTDTRVLIGVLKTDGASMLQGLDAALALVQRRVNAADPEAALLRSHVVGFTVCPPKGSHLDQPAIAETLDCVAARGLPLALYQLPQVTGNEMSPETVQALAARHPNFYLFKDTSGRDHIARSTVDFDGVFLLRSAEGDYARWPRSAGGPYDGFLLSSANAFARELNTLLRFLDEGRRDEAARLAERLARVIQGCFEMVGGFPTGNPFTNANRILDHLMAYGEAGRRREPPLLYSGARLPAGFVEGAANLLRQHGLMPPRGYLE